MTDSVLKYLLNSSSGHTILDRFKQYADINAGCKVLNNLVLESATHQNSTSWHWKIIRMQKLDDDAPLHYE